jgi:hypothetical protein
MSLLEELAGVKPTIKNKPIIQNRPKPPCVRQFANGGYSSDIIYDRFQILSSYVFQNQYIIVDHDAEDGIARDSYRKIWTFETLEEAQQKVEVLKDIPPDLGRKKRSFREALYEETKMETHTPSLSDNIPDENTSLRMIYDLILQGMNTNKILNEVIKKFPNAPHRSNFIDNYRQDLVKAGIFNGVVRSALEDIMVEVKVEPVEVKNEVSVGKLKLVIKRNNE